MAVDSLWLYRWCWPSVIWVVSGLECDASHKMAWYQDCRLIVGPFLIQSHLLYWCVAVWIWLYSFYHHIFCLRIYLSTQILCVLAFVRMTYWYHCPSCVCKKCWVNVHELGHFYKKLLSHFSFHLEWTVLTTLYENVLVHLCTWICALICAHEYVHFLTCFFIPVS
jgi:hypothetical protein